MQKRENYDYTSLSRYTHFLIIEALLIFVGALIGLDHLISLHGQARIANWSRHPSVTEYAVFADERASLGHIAPVALIDSGLVEREIRLSAMLLEETCPELKYPSRVAQEIVAQSDMHGLHSPFTTAAIAFSGCRFAKQLANQSIGADPVVVIQEVIQNELGQLADFTQRYGERGSAYVLTAYCKGYAPDRQEVSKGLMLPRDVLDFVQLVRLYADSLRKSEYSEKAVLEKVSRVYSASSAQCS